MVQSGKISTGEQMFRAYLSNNIATKSDLRADIVETKSELKQDIAKVEKQLTETKLELKQDIAKVEKQLTELGSNAKVLKWMFGVLIALIGVGVSLLAVLSK